MSDTTNINLSITDIGDAVTVLDYAAEQGAFRGWDNIRQIMALRDRLEAFVKAANAASEQPSAELDAVPSEPEDEPPGPIAALPPAASRRRSNRFSKEMN